MPVHIARKHLLHHVNLEVHIRGHLDERPYVCDRCQATFRCNDDLRKHLIIHADYKVCSFHTDNRRHLHFMHLF